MFIPFPLQTHTTHRASIKCTHKQNDINIKEHPRFEHCPSYVGVWVYMIGKDRHVTQWPLDSNHTESLKSRPLTT